MFSMLGFPSGEIHHHNEKHEKEKVLANHGPLPFFSS